MPAECLAEPVACEEHLPADGLFPIVTSQVGRFFLFTMMTMRVLIPDRKNPEDVGRQGLWDAIVAVYQRTFGAGHPCHNGPEFGLVACEVSGSVHLHAACQFARDHRWKGVERTLRLEHGIKVIGPSLPLVCPLVCSLVCSPRFVHVLLRNGVACVFLHR